ncbi:hypothetical protein CR513_08175, partial [Mucuna pruriens]
MGGNKGSTQIWVNQTTSDKENIVEHPSTSQLDQDIQSFSKEEMDRLRALLNSTSKPLGSCGLTMNSKSSFNISSLHMILDYGATNHMTSFPSYFTSHLKESKKQLIAVANGDHVFIVGSGNVQLHSSLSPHNVLHVPKLANNPIFIHRLIQDWNYVVTFFRSHCVIQELATGRTIEVSKEQGGLYYLQHTKIGNNTNKEELPYSQRATLKTWAASQIWLYHKYLGHPPFGLLKTILRLDNGIEFVNLEFSKFLKDNGVIHELMCVNTPHQKGVVERKNRHLLQVARALLFQIFVPNVYWGETVLTTTYLINRLPTRVLNGISPIKHMLSLFHSSPLMLSLPSCVFGCVAFVHSYNLRHGKLDPRSVKCVFIGYPSNKKGFKCYHPPSRWLFVSMDVTFHETQSFFDVQVQVQEVTKLTLIIEQVQMSEPDPEVSIPDNSIEDVTDDMPITLRKGKRSCVKYPISQFMCTNHLSVQHQSFIVAIDLKNENWVQAMKEEMEALEKSSTWEIVDRPKDKRVVGCRWIYIVKCKSDGTLEQYKTRLTYEIDYEETFTLVAKMNTPPTLAGTCNSLMLKMSSFLHGDLEEEVYMEILPRFYSHIEKNKVCKLKKALYELK